MATMTMKCGCKHQMQDQMYGASMRVYNECKPMNKDTAVWRCTVCEKTIQHGKPTVKEVAK